MTYAKIVVLPLVRVFFFLFLLSLQSSPVVAFAGQSLSSGEEHSLAIKKDGTLWMWGSNPMMTVDDQPVVDSVPRQVGNACDWNIVSNGRGYSIAVKKDGTLYLGEVTPQPYWSSTQPPSRLGSDSNWRDAVSSKADHYLGLKSDGRLYAWGNNFYNPLGDDSVPSSDTPVQVGTDADWVCISTYFNHNYAIKADGRMYRWGKTTSVPRQFTSDTDWAFVSVGSDHYMALKRNGTLWAWGSNNNGKLGTGGLDATNPTQVGTDNDWKSVSAGYDHTLGLKQDGSLWAWGTNSYGQLGIGTTTHATTPVRVGMDNDWSMVSCGTKFSTGIKNDGTLWAWGRNNHSQLGDGTTTDRTSPVKIGEGFQVAASASTPTNVGPMLSLLLDDDDKPSIIDYEKIAVSGLGPFDLFEATQTPGLNDTEALIQFTRNFYYSILMNTYGDIVVPAITGLPTSILQGWGVIPTFTLVARKSGNFVLPVIIVRPHDNRLMSDWGQIRLEVKDGTALLSHKVELETTRTNYGFLDSEKLYAFVPKGAYVAVKDETVTSTTDFNYGIKVVLPSGTKDDIIFKINLDGIVRDWAVLNSSYTGTFTGE